MSHYEGCSKWHCYICDACEAEAGNPADLGNPPHNFMFVDAPDWEWPEGWVSVRGNTYCPDHAGRLHDLDRDTLVRLVAGHTVPG
jgi:hypothetical protein